MKSFIRLAAAAATLAIAASAWAQQPPATPAIPTPAAAIMIVDTARVQREAKVMISIRSQVDGLRQKFQTELKAEQTQLMNSDRELAQQRATLAPEVLNQRVQDLQRRAASLQEKERQRQGQYDEALRNAMDQVRARLRRIVEDGARRRNATLVIESAMLLYGDRGLDMTDEVMRRLDQEMPTVSVVVPQAAPAEQSSGGGRGRR